MTDNKKVALITGITEKDRKYTKLQNKLGLKSDENFESGTLLSIELHLTIFKSCK